MSALVVPERIGVVDDGDDVYLAHLPEGPILSLTGTAALVWRAALDGPAPGIVDRVAAASGLAAADIAGDVTTFVETLLARGLLVETRTGGY